MNWKSKREEKRRLEKLYKDFGEHSYCRGVWKDKSENGKRKRGGTVFRIYPYSTNKKNVKKWFRRFSNRKFRRGKNESENVLNRNQHKKNFDLWWTLF
jgi:hypothetical protein